MDQSWEAKLDRILDNTEVTKNELMSYKKSNDARVSQLEVKLDECLARLSECEKRNSPANIGPSPTSDIAERELIKQQSLKNNICISGIPSIENENAIDTISKVFTALGFISDDGDIAAAYRTKSRPNSGGLLIVKFTSFEKKLELLSSKKKKRQLSLYNLKLGSKDSLVYIGNQLTPYYSSLFYKAKKAIGDGFFVSRWLSNQGVSVKLHDNTIHKIKSEEDIMSLTGILVPVHNESNTTTDEDDDDVVLIKTHPILKPSRIAPPIQQPKPDKKRRKAQKSGDEESPVSESKRGKSNKPSKNQLSIIDTNAVTKP